MNREDIIRMAQECGVKSLNPMGFFMTEQRAAFFERFAALVAAAEREKCAKVCENLRVTYGNGDPDGYECAAAIRARSKQ